MFNAVLGRARQGLRFSRLGVNLLSGSLFIGGCYQFPRLSGIESCALNDYRLFQMWVDDLAVSMNTAVHITGERMQRSGLFVSNHISWLDTIVMNKIHPLSFIARHDLEGWPLLGTFTRRMQSVYIDRSNKFHAYRSIPRIEERLREGRSVHLFPESTTSDGSSVLPFFPMFYEAAVRVACQVQPVAIKYTDSEGRHLPEAAFINDDSFMDTMARILRVERVHAHVHFCEPLAAAHYDRKELCQRSRYDIERALK
jgi:1-acyl-sn-glycerol-3-phosphate acyltransferase